MQHNSPNIPFIEKIQLKLSTLSKKLDDSSVSCIVAHRAYHFINR